MYNILFCIIFLFYRESCLLHSRLGFIHDNDCKCSIFRIYFNSKYSDGSSLLLTSKTNIMPVSILVRYCTYAICAYVRMCIYAICAHICISHVKKVCAKHVPPVFSTVQFSALLFTSFYPFQNILNILFYITSILKLVFMCSSNVAV